MRVSSPYSLALTCGAACESDSSLLTLSVVWILVVTTSLAGQSYLHGERNAFVISCNSRGTVGCYNIVLTHVRLTKGIVNLRHHMPLGLDRSSVRNVQPHW